MVNAPAQSGNRWRIAFAGVLVMICLGTVYSWSTFTRPLIAAFGWSNTETSLVFELAIFFLGIGAIVGGRWQDRVGPRMVTLVGVLLWGVGVLLAGLLTPSMGKTAMYLFYGVVGGVGLGFGYITPVAMVTKWFPDKRGLASGMVVMGFGLGAFFYNQIINRLPAFTAAAKRATAYVNAKTAATKAHAAFDPTQYALTPENVHTIMTLFVISGLAFIVIGGLGALLLRNPPAHYSVAGSAVASASGSSVDFTPSQTLRTPAFYFLWIILFLNVTAGILVVSNAIPIFSDLTGVTLAVAGLFYSYLSIFNGLGRFFWGSISDRIGRNHTYVAMYLVQVVIFFILGHLHSAAAVAICFAIVLLCYGGGFGVMPSFNADYFGTRFLGQNYGMILTAWGVGGIVGPFIAAKVKDTTGSFTGALVPVAIMLLVAAIIPFFTKRPAAIAGAAAPVA